MTIAIDVTIGGARANSYNTVAEVTALAETMARPDFTVWDALDDDDEKPVFMARAARLLDTIPFPGTLASATQARQWPRFGVDAPVGATQWGLYGVVYEPTIIPPCVKQAHAQLSVYLAVQDAQSADTFGGSEAGALSSLKVGPINLNFRADDSSAPAAGRDYLQREIYPILAAGNCVTGSRSVRLTR